MEEKKISYIDMHCDTLAEALKQKKKTVECLVGTMADAKRLHQCGVAAQFFAMFLPQNDAPAEPEDLLAGMYQIYQNTLKECSGYLAPARSYEALEKNREEGKISAFLTIENGYPVLGRMENLKRFHDMGVGLMTLTWNDPNCFGAPHSVDPKVMRQGLTEFGKEAVEYMNEIGMIVDVSHLSDGGFYDVAELAKKPFVASHSNCRSLAPSTRNLTDEMIKILAEHGGTAGLNFEPTFLNSNPKDRISRVERMCDHVCHLINTGGVECAAIGTDFDGISGEFEIEDCTQMTLLFDALARRGFSDGVIEKIAYGNAARVIRESMR